MVISRSTGSRAEGFRIRYDDYLKNFGTIVTLNTKTEVKDSMGRMTSISSTSKSIMADIQYVTKQDLLHLNVGDVEIGDGMLFVKYNETINLHDEVVFNNITWRITSQIEGELVGGEVVYKGYIIKKND